MKKTKVRKEQLKRITSKGITLIALVITIIVLLILAGVSIAMLTGENGVLTKATESKEETEIGQEKEEISMAYAGAKANKEEKVEEEVTASGLQEELKKLNSEGKASGSGTIIVTHPNGNKYKINQETGKIEGEEEGGEEEEIPAEESCVGYYADIDNDGEAEGIIYADLAKGNTGDGEWRDNGYGKYTIPVKSGFKKYYVKKRNM